MSRKLTKRELFDIRTMRYFIPKNYKGWRITQEDKVQVADYSSKGIKPTKPIGGLNANNGVFALLAGKTMRDYQITAWKEDIKDGLITKHEIISSLPEWIRAWIQQKIKDVPYDIEAYDVKDNGEVVYTGKGTTPMLVEFYRKEFKND